MEILTAMQTANRCYQKRRSANHIGILVHSTGAINRELRRYVDAPERLGKNQYGNHWNKPEADKCMHAFIGYDKDKKVIVAQTLPFSIACWGCGKGINGSYNYDPTAHIQFEICQGSDTDAAYYVEAIRVAAEFCAYLCRKYGWTAANICSHREAARKGYASNHGDPESWMKHFGDDMGQFRARVTAILGGDVAGGAVAVPEITADTTMPTVKRGSKGDAVRTLQGALMALGYVLNYGADGDFGAETLEAVEQFQRDKGLAVDGICGAKTWAAIMQATDGSDGDAGDVGEEEGQAGEPIKAELYTVTIPNVDAATASYLLESYKGASAEVVANG